MRKKERDERGGEEEGEGEGNREEGKGTDR